MFRRSQHYFENTMFPAKEGIWYYYCLLPSLLPLLFSKIARSSDVWRGVAKGPTSWKGESPTTPFPGQSDACMTGFGGIMRRAISERNVRSICYYFYFGHRFYTTSKRWFVHSTLLTVVFLRCHNEPIKNRNSKKFKLKPDWSNFFSCFGPIRGSSFDFDFG